MKQESINRHERGRNHDRYRIDDGIFKLYPSETIKHHRLHENYHRQGKGRYYRVHDPSWTQLLKIGSERFTDRRCVSNGTVCSERGNETSNPGSDSRQPKQNGLILSTSFSGVT